MNAHQLEYIDFEIEIGPGQGREYPISVVRSPAGEATDVLRFPYDSLALDNRLQALEIALLRSGGQRRRLVSPEEQTVQDFGRALFDAVMAGDVRSRYDVSRREAAGRGKGLRLKLRVQPPELAALPWEFLYDSRLGEYVCLSLNTPIVRYPAVPHPVQPLQITPPLRVLVMIANPRDLQPLDVQRERQRIEVAVQSLHERRSVSITVLEGQTWRDLQRAMRAGPWHIFHFVGHGGFDHNTEEGLVAFADDAGKAHYLTATLLGRLLADHYPLRLVLLNSCEGARGSDRDIFSSTAATLVQRGIPAVVAMQYEISDDAAIEFARTFYESIADGLPVDAAVAEARKAISMAVANTLEWGTPVLFMHAPDGRVFEVDRTAAQPTQDAQRPAPRAGQAAPGLRSEVQQRQRLEAAYTQALSAFYTRDWTRARALFEAIVAEQPDYDDAADKLKETRRQQQLAQHYAAGMRAVESQAWAEAAMQFQSALALDPDYRDAAIRLADAQRRAELADLYAEARRLHAAEAWPAVVIVFERIHAADSSYPDPDNLLSSARESLAAAQREQQLAARYRDGLRLMGVRDWAAAVSLFEAIEAERPSYAESAQLLERARQELAAQEERDRDRAAPETAAEPVHVFAATTEQPALELVESNTVASAAPLRAVALGSTTIVSIILATLGWMLAWTLLIALYISAGFDASPLVLGGPLAYAFAGWFTGLAINVARGDPSRQVRIRVAVAWSLAWAVGYPVVLLSEQGLDGPMWIISVLAAAATVLALWQIRSLARWRIAAFTACLLAAQLIGGAVGGYFIVRWADNTMTLIQALMNGILIASAFNGILNGVLVVALLRDTPPAVTQDASRVLEQREVLPAITAAGFTLAGFAGLALATFFWDRWGEISSGWWHIGWALGGLITGAVLQWSAHVRRWQAVALIAVGWAAAQWLMTGLWEPIYNYKHDPTWLPGWVAGMALAGAIGGAVTGFAVSRGADRVRRIVMIAGGWALAQAVAGLILSFYAPWSYDWWSNGNALWISGWVIAGAIAGAIGGAITLWQIQRTHTPSHAPAVE